MPSATLRLRPTTELSILRTLGPFSAFYDTVLAILKLSLLTHMLTLAA